MQNKKQNSAPRKGMNRTTPYLQEGEYSLAVNMVAESLEGNRYVLSRETSNLLAFTLPTGYKVFGYNYSLLEERLYLLITNPLTRLSSVGYVSSVNNLESIEDTEVVCEGCDYIKILEEPLEEQTQVPYASYVELLNDNCSGAFNFNMNYPVKFSELKEEKSGTIWYFTDYLNPPRHIELNNISMYTTQTFPCIDDTETICVDVDLMRIFPIYLIPEIQPEILQTGGNLKMGTYEFLIAYCNLKGDEISEYYSITNPISLFDENNKTLNQTELNSATNYGIRLKVSNLDTNYNYYKVVVIQRTNVSGTQSYFVEGIHTTTDNTILYTSTGIQDEKQNIGSVKERTTLENINAVKTKYELTRGLVSSGNKLFHWGLVAEKEINLQPIMPFLGASLKWQTSIAKENLYSFPIATSKYKGYMRDEVQPFGFRALYRNGGKSAVFPLVGRPLRDVNITEGANVYTNENDDLGVTDTNLLAVETNTPDCTDGGRTKVWQMYNTAKFEGTCPNYTPSGVTVEQDVKKTCIIEDVFTVPANTVTIPITPFYTDFLTYINDYYDYVTDPANVDIYNKVGQYLVDTYPAEHCTPTFADSCDTPVLINDENRVSAIVYTDPDNTGTFIEKTSPSDYVQNVPPTYCANFKVGSGGNVEDTDFETNFMPTGSTVYVRNNVGNNENCSYATPILNNNDITTSSVSYFHNYYGGDLITDIQLPQDVTCTDADFTNKLHKGALWFKVDKNDRNTIIFEITQNSDCEVPALDDIPVVDKLRYTIFEDCTTTTQIAGADSCNIINTTTGELFVLDTTLYPDTFYIAVDVPITSENTGVFPFVVKYRTAPPCGCFSLYTRDVEFSGVTVDFTSITIDKYETYEATCDFDLPKLNDCDPVPFKYGSFAYWESTDIYPDNKELYDGSDLSILEEDLTELTPEQIADFESDFTLSSVDGEYVLNEDNVNLRCKPIKYHKFPDNIVAPFMSSENLMDFAESAIYPLGVSLDSKVVEIFLDVAQRNGLLTLEQRDNIVGYEILKADNSIHKSIIGKGLLYDMYKYDEPSSTTQTKSVLYANFPHNDLGVDKFHFNTNTSNLIDHPYNSEKNNNFSFISPDLIYSKPALPTEISIDGYQYGASRGYIADVEGHPKWIILSQGGKNTATVLALAEFILETIVKAAELTSQQWFTFGTSSGTSLGLVGASIAAAGYAAQGAVKVGRSRYEWLTIIRNLGQPTNFASLNVSEGYLNRFEANDNKSEIVRGLSAKKYLKNSRYTFRDENNGTNFKINARDRENAVFLSLGLNDANDYNFINYPANYITYDNNKVNILDSSKFLSSENGCANGISEEIKSNVASPYVSIKNYIPNQFGEVDTLKWLTTNYSAKLTDDTTCDVIYGGTVCVSRFTYKRKVPMFRTTAMGQADLSQYNYSDYPNIGQPKYYCDYEIGADGNGFLTAVFPDIDSNYRFDCLNSGNTYIKKPSKFYLYSYGIANFLVESELNLNFRYGRPQAVDQFYPEVGDMVDWVQEKNLSIKEPNTFFYNPIYSQQVTQTQFRRLPATYNKRDWDIATDSENGVIYSNVDSSENDQTDEWLIYKSLNFYEFPKKYGKLVQLKDIESENILGRFSNQQVIFNTADTLTSQNNSIVIETGNASVFSKRPLEFATTDLGYTGTQHSDMISTEFGHITVDAKRGQIFLQRGTEATPISDVIGGKDSGKKSWFRNNLPFKILKAHPEVDVDNKFKGIGISMGYDNRFGRVFITKKDYIVKETEGLYYEDGSWLYDDTNQITEVNYSNPTYFEDVSWTVSFNFNTQSWDSYKDYKPDLYFNYNNYFQTHLNYSNVSSLNGSSWSHLLTNRSFCVFYGRKYPAIVELPVLPNGSNNILNSISLDTQSRRYQNNFDYSEIRNLGFTSATIFNNTNSSGKLNLFPELTLLDRSRYPITDIANNEQAILFTDLDNKKTFNYFFNRRKDQNNLQPLWINDSSQILKTVNNKAVTFRSKGQLERLRGQFFHIYLEDNSDSRYMTLLNFITAEEKLYN